MLIVNQSIVANNWCVLASFVGGSKCNWLMCTALEKADDATSALLREAYVAADATTPEGAAAVAKVREIYGELEIERAYLVSVHPALNF